MKSRFGVGIKMAKSYFGYHTKMKTVPFLAIVNLTNQCNFKCDFCEKIQTREELGKKSYYKIIDELQRIGTPCITFSGGEPTMHPEFLEFAKYAYGKNFYMNLSTNGSLIADMNKELDKFFDTVRISLHCSSTSFDKMTGQKGNYYVVKKNLLKFSRTKKKSKLGVNIVVTKKNIEEIESLILEINNHVDYISLLPQFSFQQNKSEEIDIQKLRQLFSLIKNNYQNFHQDRFIDDYSLNYSKNNCDAGRLYISFMPDDSIHACPFTYKSGPHFMGIINNNFSLDRLLKRKFEARCKGCYSTCTTEVSNLFRYAHKRPLAHLNKIKILLK